MSAGVFSPHKPTHTVSAYFLKVKLNKLFKLLHHLLDTHMSNTTTTAEAPTYPKCVLSGTPAFTDAMRFHRQAQGHYGTWDMMCGGPPQILANLVMETLHPDLRNLIGPRLKGKMQQRQRNWMLISEAVYKQVLSQTQAQYEALVQACEVETSRLDAVLRTDMDQIITSKEHVSSKICALVLPRAEQLLRGSVQPFLSSILEALMEPTSRGFSEVRDVFFRELVEVSKNTLNGGGEDKLGEHMEKISMLAFHPVKMQSSYEKVEQLNLEGLQQRFDVSSPSVFIQRAQILMREQMDNAVYTFEHLLHRSLEGKVQGGEDLCKTIHCCQDRVLKKYDYDSSTVRTKFFREALLQIIIPYMLKQLSPSFHLVSAFVCNLSSPPSQDLPRFQELIFEDFSQFILVENVFEEVVLQSVTKDIIMAVKEAAVQKKHNLYRDSMILTNSDPNLHLLGENPSVDWATQFRGGNEEPEGALGGGGQSSRRRRQVVSMIQLDEMGPLPYESCLEVPGVDLIPEEGEMEEEEVEVKAQDPKEPETLTEPDPPKEPNSPDSVQEIRYHSKPVVEMVDLASEADLAVLTNGTGTLMLEDGKEEEVTLITTVEDEAAIKNAIQEIEIAVQEEDGERITECAVDSGAELAPPLADSSPWGHDDSGVQPPTNEALNEGKAQPIMDALKTEDTPQVSAALSLDYAEDTHYTTEAYLQGP
uniref:Niban apoptosis regulator 2a n=1 Tax=Hucho hucho TaxID=62062 RepID=A0A4W5JMM4_9TELE